MILSKLRWGLWKKTHTLRWRFRFAYIRVEEWMHWNVKLPSSKVKRSVHEFFLVKGLIAGGTLCRWGDRIDWWIERNYDAYHPIPLAYRPLYGLAGKLIKLGTWLCVRCDDSLFWYERKEAAGAYWSHQQWNDFYEVIAGDYLIDDRNNFVLVELGPDDEVWPNSVLDEVMDAYIDVDPYEYPDESVNELTESGWSLDDFIPPLARDESDPDVLDTLSNQ